VSKRWARLYRAVVAGAVFMASLTFTVGTPYLLWWGWWLALAVSAFCIFEISRAVRRPVAGA